jgi:hypothetical protein
MKTRWSTKPDYSPRARLGGPWRAIAKLGLYDQDGGWYGGCHYQGTDPDSAMRERETVMGKDGKKTSRGSRRKKATVKDLMVKDAKAVKGGVEIQPGVPFLTRDPKK